MSKPQAVTVNASPSGEAIASVEAIIPIVKAHGIVLTMIAAVAEYRMTGTFTVTKDD